MMQQSMLRKKGLSAKANTKKEASSKTKVDRSTQSVADDSAAALTPTSQSDAVSLKASSFENPQAPIMQASGQNERAPKGTGMVISSLPDVAALPAYKLPKSTVLASEKKNAVYRCLTKRDCNLCAESLDFMNGFSPKDSQEMRARVCKTDCPTLCNGKKS